MKKRYLIVLLCFLMGMPFWGYSQSRKETQLKDAVKKLYEAMVNADSVAISKMVSGSLLYVHSGGKVEHKNEFISHITSGASDFVKVETPELFFDITGKVGIVRHVLAAETNDGGKPGSVRLRVMQVWQRKSGRWILLARQASKMN